MSKRSGEPTPYPELNEVLRTFVASAQAVLGNQFVAAYLQGSFAIGDFDVHSDVDFLVVVENEVSEAHLAALQAMHARIHQLDSPWAQHLDGSYFPWDLLRREDPSRQPLLYLDNGSSRLVWSDHDNELVVRWVVREHGIPLAGPDPKTLIDPVPEDALRQEVRETMRDWAQELFANPEKMNNRWYQPFVVISYCRMLQTLQTGRVGSKRAAVEWGKRTLDPRWTALIQRAWDERPHPSEKVKRRADAGDLARTRAFIRYALAMGDVE